MVLLALVCIVMRTVMRTVMGKLHSHKLQASLLRLVFYVCRYVDDELPSLETLKEKLTEVQEKFTSKLTPNCMSLTRTGDVVCCCDCSECPGLCHYR